MELLLKDYGIETELIIGSGGGMSVNEVINLPNNEYWFERDGDCNRIQVCKDVEYYNTQLEFKKYPSAYSEFKTSISIWKTFILKKLLNGFRLNGRDWVGTHFHLFLTKEDGSELKQKKDVKVPIVRYFLKEIFVHFSNISKEEWDSNQFIKYELERIVRSHSIWRYFDKDRMGDMLRNNMRMLGFDYINFKDGTDKQKYAPVIWSLPNAETGKPLSLEIRLMPNSYLLNSTNDKLKKDFDTVMKLVNTSCPTGSKEYTEAIKEIAELHLYLCGALIKDDLGILKNYLSRKQ